MTDRADHGFMGMFEGRCERPGCGRYLLDHTAPSEQPPAAQPREEPATEAGRRLLRDWREGSGDQPNLVSLGNRIERDILAIEREAAAHATERPDPLLRCQLCSGPHLSADVHSYEELRAWEQNNPRDTPHLDRDGDRWREHPSEARLAVTDAGPRSESRSSGGWQGGPSGDDIDRAIASIATTVRLRPTPPRGRTR